MMIKTHLTFILLASLCLVELIKPVRAEFTCDIDFAYGILVSEDQLRVMDETRTIMQINHQSQLFVGGRWIQLEKENTKLLHEYASGLHYVIPKMIILATEGVELAIETIDHVYLGLVGSDHESYEKIRRAMERVQQKVKDKFRQTGPYYTIGPGSLESVDEFVDSEIEAQLEEAISTSIGGILSAIGGINTTDPELSSDKVEQISRQLEEMGEQIEKDVGPRASKLKNKAKWFCDTLTDLNKVEEKLRRQIPALKPIDVITADKRKD
ncbi:YggN family protein [Alteromonas sp. ASW11-130]|uniref:YggN family protein n=1 Tax=Alteromonas sp. ASW11-130 TaxID=3015775 RepID=UPI0022424CE3|nr:YggN family protein [Alteromonas sp. ASW11-130]MCW8092803.1 YggN family protein [Alteromonas sp. ASW11-130]